MADINNERPLKNKSYKKRMQELDAFVMVMFSKDVTVVPRQSSWFASYPPPPPESLSAGVGAGAAARTNDSALLISQGADDPEPLPLRQSPIYTQDWIGLKSLDKRGALIFERESLHCIHPFPFRFPLATRDSQLAAERIHPDARTR